MNGHTVHVERLESGGVKVWLDGAPIRALSGWTLEEHLPGPAQIVLVVTPRRVVWGPPPPVAESVPIVDDGRRHMVWTTADARTTPSGKRACQTCGEAWMCSTATRRQELYGSVEPPAVTDHETELLRRIDAVRHRMLGLLEEGSMSTAAANAILAILNSRLQRLTKPVTPH